MDFTSEYGKSFLEDKPSKLLVIESACKELYFAGFLLKVIV